MSTLAYADLASLMTRMTGDEKHAPSALSTLDVLWTLYERVLRVDRWRPGAADRDRLLLSKGHGPMAYYAVLAAHGFVPPAWLEQFGQFGSPLGQHPDRTLIPGVELGSGSLGHGLPIAVGMALALEARRRSTPARVFVVLGDAEFDEGSNAEAVQLAGRVGLARLTAVVVDNRSAAHGWPGGLAARFAVEGWSTARADGHDHDALHAALEAPRGGRPHAVVAHTEPGAD